MRLSFGPSLIALSLLAVSLLVAQPAKAAKPLLLRGDSFSNAVYIDLLPYHRIRRAQGDATRVLSSSPLLLDLDSHRSVEVALEHVNVWSRRLLDWSESDLQGYPDAMRKQISQGIMRQFGVNSDRWHKRDVASEGTRDQDQEEQQGLSNEGVSSSAIHITADHEVAKLGYLRAALVHTIDTEPILEGVLTVAEQRDWFNQCKKSSPTSSAIVFLYTRNQALEKQQQLERLSFGSDSVKDKTSRRAFPLWLGLFAPRSHPAHPRVYHTWAAVNSISAWSEPSLCIVDLTETEVGQVAFARNRTSPLTIADLPDTVDFRVFYRMDKDSAYWGTGDASAGYVVRKNGRYLLPVADSANWLRSTRGLHSVVFDTTTGNAVSASFASSDLKGMAISSNLFRHRETHTNWNGSNRTKSVLGSIQLHRDAMFLVYDTSRASLRLEFANHSSLYSIEGGAVFLVCLVVAVLYIGLTASSIKLTSTKEARFWSLWSGMRGYCHSSADTSVLLSGTANVSATLLLLLAVVTLVYGVELRPDEFTSVMAIFFYVAAGVSAAGILAALLYQCLATEPIWIMYVMPIIKHGCVTLAIFSISSLFVWDTAKPFNRASLALTFFTGVLLQLEQCMDLLVGIITCRVKLRRGLAGLLPLLVMFGITISFFVLSHIYVVLDTVLLFSASYYTQESVTYGLWLIWIGSAVTIVARHSKHVT